MLARFYNQDRKRLQSPSLDFPILTILAPAFRRTILPERWLDPTRRPRAWLRNPAPAVRSEHADRQR